MAEIALLSTLKAKPNENGIGNYVNFEDFSTIIKDSII